ncbi:hypothetical protein I7V27_09415 [Lelliottia amnigena]|uniref:Uncharacterized protein n=1 Tax=Lelliottia amnigena TaxID=61646 RepID=A0AAP2EZG0_LELAM|nr:hypothetical protein [Lelliottia amnigena]MBL5899164.1 hypothetical protein [Lelliottia amnigena]MBL5934678.1 hypothetical protein [Lelliottia amnigena]
MNKLSLTSVVLLLAACQSAPVKTTQETVRRRIIRPVFSPPKAGAARKARRSVKG